jgi:hypothetical protein
MTNKTTMMHLLEKIERMPEKNIKNYLKILGILYLEAERDQMIYFAMDLHRIDCSITGTDILINEAEQHYDKTYGTGNI